MFRLLCWVVTILIAGVVVGFAVQELQQREDGPRVICAKTLKETQKNASFSVSISQEEVEEVVNNIETALKNERVRLIFRQMPSYLFGMVVDDGDGGLIIKLNPNFPPRLIWSTFLHESLHVAYPYWEHSKVFAMEKYLLDNLTGEQVDRLMRIFPLLLFRDVAEEAHLWDNLLQRKRSSQQ
jgi:hypothetical protein